jgi:hypothetical protein
MLFFTIKIKRSQPAAAPTGVLLEFDAQVTLNLPSRNPRQRAEVID